MQIWLGVKDFAKIENAKVHLGKYVLFVGQNNSGKTFLMQLVQGVLEKLADFIDERALTILLDEEEETYSSYVVSNENISQLTNYLNEKLTAEKENIVKEIFRREIPIGELYVDCRLNDNSAYKFFVLDAKKDFEEQLGKIVESDVFTQVSEVFRSVPVDKVCIVDHVDLENNKLKTILLSGMFSSSEATNHSTVLRGSRETGFEI